MKSFVWVALFLTFPASYTAWAESPDAPASEEKTLKVTTGPPEQRSGLFRFFGLGMCIAAAGDAASTEWALTRPEISEYNPLMANRGVRLSAHVVAPATMWWTTERMRKSGHRRSALLLRIGTTAGYTYLTIHNLRTAARY